MELQALVTLFLAALVLMIKPGPYMMTFLSLSVEGKIKTMLVFWLGYNLTNSLVYIFLLSSLSMLPTGFGMIFLFIKAIAAIMFVTLGLKGLQDNIQSYQDSSKEKVESLSGIGFLSIFGMAAMLSISNPYDLVFTVTMIPTLVNQTQFTFLEILLIRGTVMTADVLILLCYCLPILFMRNKFKMESLRKIKIGSSVVLILIGLYIFATVFMRWDLIKADLIS